jgi:hypothetical protein
LKVKAWANLILYCNFVLTFDFLRYYVTVSSIAFVYTVKFILVNLRGVKGLVIAKTMFLTQKVDGNTSSETVRCLRRVAVHFECC